MVKEYVSETCRILLFEQTGGWATLYIYDLTDPEKRPFYHQYEAGQKLLWNRDLDTLVGATGTKEIQHAA